MLQLQCQWPCTFKYCSKHSLDLCLQINKWWPAEGCSLQLQPPWRLRRTSSYARAHRGKFCQWSLHSSQVPHRDLGAEHLTHGPFFSLLHSVQLAREGGTLTLQMTHCNPAKLKLRIVIVTLVCVFSQFTARTTKQIVFDSIKYLDI